MGRASVLLLLLLVGSGPRALAETAIPESAAVAPPDSGGVAAPDSTRIASPPVGAYIVSLLDGEEIVAARIEPSGLGTNRIIRPDGRASYEPSHRIRSVKGLDGKDWTHAILDWRKALGSMNGVPSGSHDFAFRGRPGPETKTFLITHVGVLARTDEGSPLYAKDGAYAITDLGLMRNVSRRVAVGGDLYFGGDEDRIRIGPKARVRYWMSRDVSIDVAPGILVWAHDNWSGETRLPGFVGEASLSVQDLVLLTAEIESVKLLGDNGKQDQDTSVYVGGKFGGQAAFIGMAVGFLIVAVMHGAVDIW